MCFGVRVVCKGEWRVGRSFGEMGQWIPAMVLASRCRDLSNRTVDAVIGHIILIDSVLWSQSTWLHPVNQLGSLHDTNEA